MVDVLDLEVGVALIDQLAERRDALGVAVVGHGREARRERGEGLGGGAGARELLVVERHGAVEVVDGDEAPVEPAFRDGDGGAALGLGGMLVECTAVDPLERRDRVCAHALVGLGVELLQVGVARAHRKEALLAAATSSRCRRR